MNGFSVLAGVLAGALTLLDLDERFYVPHVTAEKVKLQLWWWDYVLGNALLAGALYVYLSHHSQRFQDMDEWLRALVVGLGYLALVRLKLTTFQHKGQTIPFGAEVFYNQAKSAVYRRINDIATKAFVAESEELATAHSLADLAAKARTRISLDQVWLANEEADLLAWINQVVKEEGANEVDKRQTVAAFLLSGRRV
jgi:hypothetical protein